MRIVASASEPKNLPLGIPAPISHIAAYPP
jgi:hypothetical protein